MSAAARACLLAAAVQTVTPPSATAPEAAPPTTPVTIFFRAPARPPRTERHEGAVQGNPNRGHESGYTYGQITVGEPVMRFASVAEVKNQFSRHLAVSRRKREPIVVTHHGKPYALIQPLSEQDLEELEWKGLAKRRLERAWEGDGDGLYDYL